MSVVIFADACTGTNGQNVTARTPDTGAGYSLVGTATGTIQSNAIQADNSSDNTQGIIRCDPSGGAVAGVAGFAMGVKR